MFISETRGNNGVCHYETKQEMKAIALLANSTGNDESHHSRPVERPVITWMYVEGWDDSTKTWQMFQEGGGPSSRGNCSNEELNCEAEYSCSDRESNCKDARGNDGIHCSRVQ